MAETGGSGRSPKSKVDPSVIVNAATAIVGAALVLGVWQMHDDLLVLQTVVGAQNSTLSQNTKTVDSLKDQVGDHEHRITHLEDTVYGARTAK